MTILLPRPEKICVIEVFYAIFRRSVPVSVFTSAYIHWREDFRLPNPNLWAFIQRISDIDEFLRTDENGFERWQHVEHSTCGVQNYQCYEDWKEFININTRDMETTFREDCIRTLLDSLEIVELDASINPSEYF